jgi:hypothetical protein
MHITTATTLAIFAIVMAIALVTAGSLAVNAEAVKKTKKTSTHRTSSRTSGGSTGTITLGGSTSTTGTTKSTSTSKTSTGLSKFISCVRALPTLTRADAVNCYNTVFGPGSSAGSTAGAGTSLGHTGIGSGTGSSAGSTAGAGTIPGY